MARGTTWFKAKRDKLRKQMMAQRHPGTSTPACRSIAASDAMRSEVTTLVAYGFHGAVVHGPQGEPVPPIGKGKRALDTRTYGNFKPRRGAAVTPDVYATGALLIRAGEVIGAA